MIFEGPLFAFGFLAGVLLGGFTLYLWLNKRTSVQQFVFWEAVSIIVAMLAAFPGLLDWIVSFFGISFRGLFVLAVAVFVLFGLVYTQAVNNQATRKQVRHLAQEIALMRYQVEYGLNKETQSRSDNDSL